MSIPKQHEFLFRLIIPFLLCLPSLAAWGGGDLITAGETVFLRGGLPNGQLVRGNREGGVFVEGEGAACINCHRRSGLGSFAGNIIIPPITGKYLFRSAEENAADLDAPHVMVGAFPDKNSSESYNDKTVARAIREGVGRGGRTLNFLMPRFDLDDTTMASLIAHLKKLSSAPVLGVTDDTLHFATIITPDADPVAKQGMLDVINHFVEDKNSFIRGGARPMKNPKGIMYRVTRRWQLHIWELKGSPETWEQQLHNKLVAEPVYAVISGLGKKTWDPVHQFCSHERIPCLFANTDDPVVNEQDFYPVYFSKGVTLEAQIILQRLKAESDTRKVGRVVQLYRQGDIGEHGAHKIHAQLEADGKTVLNKMLIANGSKEEVSGSLKDIKESDVLVLWLRPDDLLLLPRDMVASKTVYVSGLMGGLENIQVPAEWRPSIHMTYPMDLPELRKVRMNYPLSWFKIKHIPLISERVQSDTYLACGILSEALSHMLDSYERDYLVERIEDMLSRRLITGYYPRLTLAPKQRFASKGGYLVRLDGESGTKVRAESDWIVP
jgi:hypothetical protein